MPGSLPLMDTDTRNEMSSYLVQGCAPVLERDADGARSDTWEMENKDTCFPASMSNIATCSNHTNETLACTSTPKQAAICTARDSIKPTAANPAMKFFMPEGVMCMEKYAVPVNGISCASIAANDRCQYLTGIFLRQRTDGLTPGIDYFSGWHGILPELPRPEAAHRHETGRQCARFKRGQPATYALFP